MSPDDLPDVLDIERLSSSHPLTEEMFFKELSLEIAHLYVVRHKNDADCRDRVIGYIDYWKIGPEIHIIIFAVHPDFRRQGAGSVLLQYLIDKAWREGGEEILLDVRVSNEAASSLYRKFGFVECGRRKNYYQDHPEDAILMHLQKK